MSLTGGGGCLSIEMSPAWEITNESYRGGGGLFINRDESSLGDNE